MSWIDQFVTEGMTAVDVGANVGEVTKQLCHAVGPSGAVYAIEPQAALHTKISDRAPRARRIQCAIGEVDGWRPLWLSERSPHASLWRQNVLVDVGQSEGVPVRSLDSLRASGELPKPIHAIKVDTQGAETFVVRGARALLKSDRPLLYLEVWPHGLEVAESSVDDLCCVLQDVGYVPKGRTWEQVVALTIGATINGSDDVLFVPEGNV